MSGVSLGVSIEVAATSAISRFATTRERAMVWRWGARDAGTDAAHMLNLNGFLFNRKD